MAQDKFLHAGMTPRAWRMISYSCVGFLIYGLVLLIETLQNFQMNRIDQQMQQVYRQEYAILEEEQSSVAASTAGAAEVTPSPPQ